MYTCTCGYFNVFTKLEFVRMTKSFNRFGGGAMEQRRADSYPFGGFIIHSTRYRPYHVINFWGPHPPLYFSGVFFFIGLFCFALKPQREISSSSASAGNWSAPIKCQANTLNPLQDDKPRTLIAGRCRGNSKETSKGTPKHATSKKAASKTLHNNKREESRTKNENQAN